MAQEFQHGGVFGGQGCLFSTEGPSDSLAVLLLRLGAPSLEVLSSSLGVSELMAQVALDISGSGVVLLDSPVRTTHDSTPDGARRTSDDGGTSAASPVEGGSSFERSEGSASLGGGTWFHFC